MRLRIWLASFLGLVVIFPAGLWISIALQVRAGERYFREKYPPGRDFYVVMSDYEWANLFAGRAGLRRLEALSHDQSVAPGAGRIAQYAHDYIRNGGFLREIRQLKGMYSFGDAPLFWVHLRSLEIRETILGLLPFTEPQMADPSGGR